MKRAFGASSDRLLPLAVAGALLAMLVGCGSCGEGCSDRTVATVSEADGEVQRDHVAAVETWQTASVPDAIRMGEGVRTGANGRAVLELAAGGGLRLGPDSMVRFGGRASETPSLEWERGTIDIETDEAFLVTTDFGPLRIQPGTRLSAVYGERGVRIEVVFGLAELADGTRLHAGDAFEDRAGGGTVTVAEAPENHALGEAELRSLSDAGVGSADGGDESPESGTHSGPRVAGLDGYEFSVAGGAGGVIHHPAPPAIVGIETGCGDGEVRVESGGAVTTYTGGGTVGVRVSRGEARYEVRCARQVTTSGRFVVTIDAGRRRLNTRSQRHTVVADGRRYTFLYEGALPTLLLRWNAAPEAELFTVNLTGTRRLTQLTSPTPSASVPMSALRDGEMTFQFSANGRESPRTTITLRYDTATPTAMLESPPDRSFAGSSAVTVSGTAQLGSQVAVGGQPLEVDVRGAFAGTTRSESGGLAVRITSPNHGTHYFVRRSAGR